MCIACSPIAYCTTTNYQCNCKCGLVYVGIYMCVAGLLVLVKENFIQYKCVIAVVHRALARSRRTHSPYTITPTTSGKIEKFHCKVVLWTLIEHQCDFIFSRINALHRYATRNAFSDAARIRLASEPDRKGYLQKKLII